MTNRKVQLIRSFLRGSVRKYVGAIFAVAVAVVVGLATPLVLEETIDAVIGAKRPLNLPGFLGKLIADRGGRDAGGRHYFEARTFQMLF